MTPLSLAAAYERDGAAKLLLGRGGIGLGMLDNKFVVKHRFHLLPRMGNGGGGATDETRRHQPRHVW